MSNFFAGKRVARMNDIIERLLSADSAAAFEEYKRSGDETQIQELFDQLLDWPSDDSTQVDGLSEEEVAEQQRERLRSILSREPGDWKAE